MDKVVICKGIVSIFAEREYIIEDTKLQEMTKEDLEEIFKQDLMEDYSWVELSDDVSIEFFEERGVEINGNNDN